MLRNTTTAAAQSYRRTKGLAQGLNQSNDFRIPDGVGRTERGKSNKLVKIVLVLALCVAGSAFARVLDHFRPASPVKCDDPSVDEYFTKTINDQFQNFVSSSAATFFSVYPKPPETQKEILASMARIAQKLARPIVNVVEVNFDEKRRLRQCSATLSEPTYRSPSSEELKSLAKSKVVRPRRT